MRALLLFAIVILAACNKTGPKQVSESIPSVDAPLLQASKALPEDIEEAVPAVDLDDENQVMGAALEEKALFQLTDTLNADFNGDGYIDQALFLKEGDSSGIVISHGRLDKKVRIGFGEPFDHLTTFNWADGWGILYDSLTYEIIIENAEVVGDSNIVLENPSIIVRREEEGGGLITYLAGRYTWIHQAD